MKDVKLLNDWKEAVEQYLYAHLPSLGRDEGGLAAEAAAYSVNVGGKRIRPLLLIASAVLCGSTPDAAMPYAAALEMIHTYSLIHDDLPAMDDDDFRRGQPSCHAAFGEAHAMLAGDGLLTFAFETMLGALVREPSAEAAEAALVIARAAGFRGMIAGQCLDLSDDPFRDAEQRLRTIQEKKTGALIRAAVMAGAALAGAGNHLTGRLDRFAASLGLAFQIKDDLLDAESTSETLGKTIGKDARDNKLTFVTLYGNAEAARHFETEMGIAQSMLDGLAADGVDVSLLAAIWRYLNQRTM